MGASKTENYSEEQNQLATIAKALGHPARIAILDYIMSVQSCICGDIVNVLPLAQPTVSQHLKELKNAGIIKGNVEGSAICYCINEDALQELVAYFSKLKSVRAKISTCC